MAFRDNFPDMQVDVLSEYDLKGVEADAKWKPIIEKFSDLDDSNVDTLIRKDASKEMFLNSLLCLRIQFYAVEIARNREGLNDSIREKMSKRLESE